MQEDTHWPLVSVYLHTHASTCTCLQTRGKKTCESSWHCWCAREDRAICFRLLGSFRTTHNKSMAFCSVLGLGRGWQVLSFRPKAAYCLLLHSLLEGNGFYRLASEADMMMRITNLKPKLAKCYPKEFYPCLRRTLWLEKKKSSITIAFWICQ